MQAVQRQVEQGERIGVGGMSELWEPDDETAVPIDEAAPVSAYGRKWKADEVVEAKRTILVAASDGAPVPAVAGAVKLAAAAEANGWTAKLTYALVEVGDAFYLNGNLRQAAHRLASVCVALRRPPSGGYAAWYSADDAPYGFDRAFIDFARHGWRAGKLPSILDRVAADRVAVSA